MSKGRRYETQSKLNIKKVIAVIVAIVVIIMFIIILQRLITTGKEKGKSTVVSYFPVYTKEKWGVIDSTGNIVIEPTMEEMITIPDSKTDLFLCTYEVNYETGDYKTKVLDAKKKEKFTEYNRVEAIENMDKQHNVWYEQGVLKVKKEDQYGLINLAGKEILPIEYTNIRPLLGVKNSIIIEKEGKVGLVDNKGSIIIAPEYKEIKGIQEDYTKGYIVVNEQDQYGIIDFNKKVILEPKYEEIQPVVGNNCYVVKEQGTKKVINQAGEEQTKAKFDTIKEIYDQNMIYRKNNKYGVMTTTGESLIKAEYQEINHLFGDYYAVKKADHYGVLTTTGETILPFEYEYIQYRKEGDFIEVTTKDKIESDLYNTNFEKKLTGIISEVNGDKGYIRIRIEEQYHYYNLKFEEQQAQNVLTSHTLFLSKKDGKYGYVDKDGKVMVDYIYEDGQEQNSFGYVAVKKDGKWGALDEKGKQVAECNYLLSENLIIDFIGKWHIAEDINSYYYTDKE